MRLEASSTTHVSPLMCPPELQNQHKNPPGFLSCMGDKEGLSSPQLHFRFAVGVGVLSPDLCLKSWQTHREEAQVPRKRPEVEVALKLSKQGR